MHNFRNCSVASIKNYLYEVDTQLYLKILIVIRIFEKPGPENLKKVYPKVTENYSGLKFGSIGPVTA